MKINLSKMNFSIQIIIVFIVLLVYTFYFVDEELLVSLMTTVVLLGAYNMGSNSVNMLFMSNINSLFQKFSIYILMNIYILKNLIVRFNKISLVWVYHSFYTILFTKTFSKIGNVEALFFRSVNLLIYNMLAFLLSANLYRKFLVNSKFSNLLTFIDSGSAGKLFLDSRNKSFKDEFVMSIVKLIFKS